MVAHRVWDPSIRRRRGPSAATGLQLRLRALIIAEAIEDAVDADDAEE